jgi:hypothetical protein
MHAGTRIRTHAHAHTHTKRSNTSELVGSNKTHTRLHAHTHTDTRTHTHTHTHTHTSNVPIASRLCDTQARNHMRMPKLRAPPRPRSFPIRTPPALRGNSSFWLESRFKAACSAPGKMRPGKHVVVIPAIDHGMRNAREADSGLRRVACKRSRQDFEKTFLVLIVCVFCTYWRAACVHGADRLPRGIRHGQAGAWPSCL